MTATVIYCSTKMLAAKSIHASCTYIEIFTSAFAGKLYEQIATLILSRSVEMH